jgi:NAD(P)-dependent dehydrogenase (short-subunit alcohol dehydrogenase family)
MGGKVTFPGGGAYHGSKHALEALSDALRFEVAGFGVDVIVIQPGLIATRFFSTAVASMGHGGASGRYAALDKVVAEATQHSTTTGALAGLSGTPDDVARTIERAISTRRPRTRYKVAGSAHLLMGLRRMLGDRGWDRLLRTFYPQPRP